MDKEILNVIKERGLLLEREIYELLECFGNVQMARDFLENLEKFSGQKFITKNILNKNYEYVRGVVEGLPDSENVLEKVSVKLGLSVEVKKEKVVRDQNVGNRVDYKVFYARTIAHLILPLRPLIRPYLSVFLETKKEEERGNFPAMHVEVSQQSL